MPMKKIALTGIKPTGTPHIGNYLGMSERQVQMVLQGSLINVVWNNAN
jgi:tryptophanyl-tRNA synthetase